MSTPATVGFVNEMQTVQIDGKSPEKSNIQNGIRCERRKIFLFVCLYLDAFIYISTSAVRGINPAFK